MPADGYLHAYIRGNGVDGANFQLTLTGAKKTTPVYAPHNYDVTWEVSKGEVLTLTWTRANYVSYEDTRGSFYTYPAGE